MGVMSILADPPGGTTSPYTTLYTTTSPYTTSPSWIKFDGAIAVPVCILTLPMIVDF